MKKLSLINIILISILSLISSFLLYNYFQIKNQLFGIDLGLNKLTENQYTFILREIDNNFTLITVTVTVLFGLTAFFISFNISNIIQNSKRDIEKKVANWEAQQNIQMTKIHKLEGDLNLTTYYGLQVSAELIIKTEDNHEEVSQIYLAMAERVALAIQCYKSANFEFEQNLHSYIKEDLTEVKNYIQSIDDFESHNLSYSRYIDLVDNINSVVDKETSFILHEIGAKIKFNKLEG